MKFYIVDDVRSIIKVLERIIEDRKLGEAIGFSEDAVTATAEIIAMKPDIVLVDLLMPVKDGVSIVNEVKQVSPDIRFIMISQVSDKEMVSDAYNAGVEFFISKPINLIEVESVVKRVIKQVEMENTLGGLRNILGISASENEEKGSASSNSSTDDGLKAINYLLGVLGMLGERGTGDIQEICRLSISTDNKNLDEIISRYCEGKNESEKIVKQRIRRAVKKGLRNMAHMGVEDSYSEIFQNYAQLVFDFENLRKEMDFLREISDEEGKANLYHFIEGLLIYSENR